MPLARRRDDRHPHLDVVANVGPDGAEQALHPRGQRVSAVRTIDGDEVVRVATVRNIGGKTFYFRNKRWVDSLTTAKQEKDAIIVKRYSKEYFELVTKHGKDVAKYLALEGKVTLVLDGKTYSF